MKNKVLVILGTRPEIIRLSCTIKKLNDKITKYVYTNNKLLYEKIKFIMIHINNSL